MRKKGRKLRNWKDTIREEDSRREKKWKKEEDHNFPFSFGQKIVTSQSESITTNGHRGGVKVKYSTTTSLPSDLLVFNCINRIKDDQ